MGERVAQYRFREKSIINKNMGVLNELFAESASTPFPLNVEQVRTDYDCLEGISKDLSDLIYKKSWGKIENPLERSKVRDYLIEEEILPPNIGKHISGQSLLPYVKKFSIIGDLIRYYQNWQHLHMLETLVELALPQGKIDPKFVTFNPRWGKVVSNLSNYTVKLPKYLQVSSTEKIFTVNILDLPIYALANLTESHSLQVFYNDQSLANSERVGQDLGYPDLEHPDEIRKVFKDFLAKRLSFDFFNGTDKTVTALAEIYTTNKTLNPQWVTPFGREMEVPFLYYLSGVREDWDLAVAIWLVEHGHYPGVKPIHWGAGFTRMYSVSSGMGHGLAVDILRQAYEEVTPTGWIPPKVIIERVTPNYFDAERKEDGARTISKETKMDEF